MVKGIKKSWIVIGTLIISPIAHCYNPFAIVIIVFEDQVIFNLSGC